MRLVLALLWAAIFVCSCVCDDSPGPGFFLKITKNVPRLGRRSESFFTKNSKTIPRIGRRDEALTSQDMMTTDNSRISDWLMNASISKRLMMRAAAAAEPALSVVQPVNSNTLIDLLNKDAIPSEHFKFVHWKDFDRALQSDMDLYAKVISLGRSPDQRLKEDLGYNSYIPVSFFTATRKQGLDDNFYYKSNNENPTAADQYRDILRYNELK